MRKCFWNLSLKDKYEQVFLGDLNKHTQHFGGSLASSCAAGATSLSFIYPQDSSGTGVGAGEGRAEWGNQHPERAPSLGRLSSEGRRVWRLRGPVAALHRFCEEHPVHQAAYSSGSSTRGGMLPEANNAHIAVSWMIVRQ